MDRILAIDDDAVNIAIVEEILSDRYGLVTAASGEDAIRLARIVHPDLILLDVVMPGLDGLETCRLLRADPSLRQSKIILVSGRADVQDRLKGYEVGADDYLTKPFDPEELLAKVRVFLRLKHIEELDRSKRDILLLLNHETRTPLTIILSALHLLENVPELSPTDTREMIRSAVSGARRLQELLEKAMTLWGIQSGAIPMRPEATSLATIVDEAVVGLARFAAERPVRIELRVDGPTDVQGDRTHLLFAIRQVLHNAIRFSPPNGHVTVDLSPDEGCHTVAVTDHGQGIPAALLPHVFEAFVASDDLLHHSEGHGLSLAISREILKRHGGRIAVESTPGLRTSVRLEVPTSRLAAKKPAARVPRPEEPAPTIV